MPRKTLLEICQEVVEGVKDIGVPSTIIGNAAPEAKLLKSMATKVGRELERGYNWQTLKRTHTFTTTVATAYDLPDDYRRPAPLTQWDRTGDKPLIGANNIGFQALQSGIIVGGGFHYFQVYGDQFNLSPAPSSGTAIAYDYYSSQFIENSNGDGLDDWVSDSNICRLDGDLMVLGVVYRYLSRQGAPFAEEKGDYLQAIQDLQADDTPAPLIDVGPSAPGLSYDNIPDGPWDLS